MIGRRKKEGVTYYTKTLIQCKDPHMNPGSPGSPSFFALEGDIDPHHQSLFPVNPFRSSSSPSLSLHLSPSSPTAKMVSPSRLSLGSGVGLVGIGAGKGLASRLLLEASRLLPRGASYAGGLGVPSSSSSSSKLLRTEAISKPSSSCAICLRQ